MPNGGGGNMLGANGADATRSTPNGVAHHDPGFVAGKEGSPDSRAPANKDKVATPAVTGSGVSGIVPTLQ